MVPDFLEIVSMHQHKKRVLTVPYNFSHFFLFLPEWAWAKMGLPPKYPKFLLIQKWQNGVLESESISIFCGVFQNLNLHWLIKNVIQSYNKLIHVHLLSIINRILIYMIVYLGPCTVKLDMINKRGLVFLRGKISFTLYLFL